MVAQLAQVFSPDPDRLVRGSGQEVVRENGVELLNQKLILSFILQNGSPNFISLNNFKKSAPLVSILSST